MTNKYKFRGKSLKTGEWVYGSLLQINDYAYIYPYKTADLDDIDFGGGFVKVSKESVGQGLKDKNGVEVYEHDLMFEFNHTTRKYDAVGIVTFGNFSAEIYDCKGWFLADKNGNQISEAGLDDDFSGVIGNIHDNPELLNAQ